MQRNTRRTRRRLPKDGAAMSFKDIGRALGISPQQAQNDYVSALRKLSEHAVMQKLMQTVLALDSMRQREVDLT